MIVFLRTLFVGPQPHNLAQYTQFARVIRIMVGDDVDLAQNIVPVLGAIGTNITNKS